MEEKCYIFGLKGFYNFNFRYFFIFFFDVYLFNVKKISDNLV